jgi:hypothetical protein
MAAAWDDVVTDNVTIDTAENHNARTTEIKRKVQGPDSSTDNSISRFDGTDVKVVQGSLATIDDSGSINIPTGETYDINGTPHTHALATTSAAGMLKTLSNVNTEYMNGAGNWSTPSGGEGTSDHAALSHLAYADAGHTGFEPAIGAKGTAFNKNYGATATDVKINGTQAVGTTDAIARIDHVHPTDTSRFRGAGIYNVLDYGATGNGTADDTTYLQAAIDAAEAAGGGLVYFPKGTYKITSGLTMTVAVSMAGQGSDFTNFIKYPTASLQNPISVIKWGTTGAGTILTVTGILGGMSWRDLAFSGEGYATNGIQMDRVQKSTFSNIKVEKCLSYGILLYPQSSEEANGQNCMFNHFNDICVIGCGQGIKLTGTKSGGVLWGNCCHNTFINLELSNTSTNLYLEICDNNNFYGVWTNGGASAELLADAICNYFYSLQGVPVTYAGSNNTVYAYSRDNGQALPTIASGSKLVNFWAPWTSTFTWTTGTPSTFSKITRYVQIERIVHFTVSFVTTDGNGATGLTFTLPVTPYSSTYLYTQANCTVVVAGVATVIPAYIDGSGIVQFFNFPTLTDGATSYVNVSGFYEVEGLYTI